ncbi:hypothetical protein H181DRAFT_00917 [Streptomyces sp. WMMB 714]|jgi:Flp pilus assembly pilin Flp|uniref:hypothetical protein n=1 Tax=Streptomyces sp. WMMB 714 TaxID=1286822 RepID=UPI0005F7BE69|nr:hypothetical protein [Streptomyces sp. WMMB 714]SCK14264.1 hypothetical protein H181DRAFT_00917 [Streptomyces sp. WMMB 714]
MSRAIRNWRRRVMERMHDREGDRGASAIEYAGIVILVAGIILAIRALGLPAQISGALDQWISAIVGS